MLAPSLPEIQIQERDIARMVSLGGSCNRCELSGRPKGYYRKLKLSRIALRELASKGQIPGMTKSSW